MSSFMVGDKTLNAIVNYLASDRDAGYFKHTAAEKFDIDFERDKFGAAAALGAKLRAMNDAALAARYGKKHGMGFDAPYKYELMHANIYATIKAMHCLLYQCSEGDIDSSELYEFIEKYSNSLMKRIISRTPEYDKAAWGD